MLFLIPHVWKEEVVSYVHKLFAIYHAFIYLNRGSAGMDCWARGWVFAVALTWAPWMLSSAPRILGLAEVRNTKKRRYVTYDGCTFMPDTLCLSGSDC